MTILKTSQETFSFADTPKVPEIEVRFSACRMKDGHYLFDILDGKNKTLNRWQVPMIEVPGVLERLKEQVPQEKLPFEQTHEDFIKNLMVPHVAHLTEQGMLVACPANGFCLFVVDTKANQCRTFPENPAQDPHLYVATGDLSSDGKKFLLIRWSFEDSIKILRGDAQKAQCEIGWLDLEDLSFEKVYEVENFDRIHQITASESGRHLVFTSFQSELNVPYPKTTIEVDPEGFRKSHAGGIKKETMVTVDLEKKTHWRMEIPVPVPAHFEFDPLEPDVMYVSAHNFSWVQSAAQVIIEGPATLFKMRIKDGETKIEDNYSDDKFFRITQHMVFVYEGLCLIAVTNVPNKLDFIDAETMNLWRRVELFETPEIDLTKTGNAMCPLYPEMCLNISPSTDGRYVVLESSVHYRVYDLKEDRMLEGTIPLFLPDGAKRIGHTRPVGL